MKNNRKTSVAAVFSAVALTTLATGCNIYIRPAPTAYDPPVVIVPPRPRGVIIYPDRGHRHHRHHHHRRGRW